MPDDEDRRDFLHDVKLESMYLNDPLMLGLMDLKAMKSQKKEEFKINQEIETDELVTFLLGEIKDPSLVERVSKRIQGSVYKPEFNEYVELGEMIASDFARELRDRKVALDTYKTSGEPYLSSTRNKNHLVAYF